jgi:ABC-type siderophore export system fused ATPase/permease subunit
MNITFSDKILAILSKKVEDHNEKHSHRVSLEELITIYKRGEKAVSSIYRPAVSTAQWALARVNLFLHGASEHHFDATYKNTDEDILERRPITYIDEASEFFYQFKDTDLTIARTDLLLGGITDKDAEHTFIPPSEVDKTN